MERERQGKEEKGNKWKGKERKTKKDCHRKMYRKGEERGKEEIEMDGEKMFKTEVNGRKGEELKRKERRGKKKHVGKGV